MFGARLAHALPRFYYEKESERAAYTAVSTAMLITIAVSIPVMLSMLTSSEVIAITLFDSSTYANIVALFSILIVTQAIEAYGLSFIRIKEKALLFISFSLAKLVVQLSLNIYFVVFLEWGVLGVAISSALSSSLFAIALGLYTVRNTGISFNRSDGKRMIIFCWPLWLAGFASVYISSSNRYFIKLLPGGDKVFSYFRIS